jgi:hypothetical protein
MYSSYPLSDLLAQRDVLIRDLLDEVGVWIIKHDMEVLHSMDRLEYLPILEPDDLFSS